MHPPLWLYPAVFVLTVFLTAMTLRTVRRLRIVDIPNARSSHNLPTPKGGGIAFALVISACLIVSGSPDSPVLTVLGMSGLLVAIVGLVDDVQGLSALTRFTVQLAAAGWFFPLLPLGFNQGFNLDQPGLLGAALAALALVSLLWVTNLYNFMDGIDGIAALQAILLGAGIHLVHTLGLYPGQLAWLALLIGCAAAGFMVFNFPPARLFMGDTGSAFLGFVIAGAAIVDSYTSPEVLWLWLLLLAGFVCDATATLLCRVFQGKPFHQAHRSHVYQLFVRRHEESLLAKGASVEAARHKAHRRYLLLFTLVFCMFQLPAALLVATGSVPGIAGTTLVYGILLGAYAIAGAGRESFLLYGSMRKKHSR